MIKYLLTACATGFLLTSPAYAQDVLEGMKINYKSNKGSFHSRRFCSVIAR
jgi:hypothetical protein